MIQNILNWLVMSSDDPSQVSMTVKGVLLNYVGFLVSLLFLFHIQGTQAQVTQYIVISCQVFGYILAIIGFVRKIILTIKPSWATVPKTQGVGLLGSK